MDVWHVSSGSLRERMELSPVQKHSIHQPSSPQVIKLVNRFFFMYLVLGEEVGIFLMCEGDYIHNWFGLRKESSNAKRIVI